MTTELERLVMYDQLTEERNMKKAKWIHQDNMPRKLPIWPSAVVWLLLDRTQAAGWVQGMSWTIMAILWIAAIACILKSERMEAFK